MILVFQENSQIHVFSQITTNIRDRSFSRSSKGATDVINTLKAYFNSPTAAIISQNK